MARNIKTLLPHLYVLEDQPLLKQRPRLRRDDRLLGGHPRNCGGYNMYKALLALSLHRYLVCQEHFPSTSGGCLAPIVRMQGASALPESESASQDMKEANFATPSFSLTGKQRTPDPDDRCPSTQCVPYRNILRNAPYPDRQERKLRQRHNLCNQLTIKSWTRTLYWKGRTLIIGILQVTRMQEHPIITEHH